MYYCIRGMTPRAKSMIMRMPYSASPYRSGLSLGLSLKAFRGPDCSFSRCEMVPPILSKFLNSSEIKLSLVCGENRDYQGKSST